MTDEAERKVREWATKRNGDPLTPRDVVELALAVDEDATSRHKETMDVVQPLAEEFKAHCVDNDRRFEALEQRSCLDVSSARTLIEAEHSARHGEHMRYQHSGADRRAGDEPASDHRDERDHSGDEVTRREHWLMWLVGSKVAQWAGQAAIAGGVGALVAFLVTK